MDDSGLSVVRRVCKERFNRDNIVLKMSRYPLLTRC